MAMFSKNVVQLTPGGCRTIAESAERINGESGHPLVMDRNDGGGKRQRRDESKSKDPENVSPLFYGVREFS